MTDTPKERYALPWRCPHCNHLVTTDNEQIFHIRQRCDLGRAYAQQRDQQQTDGA